MDFFISCGWTSTVPEGGVKMEDTPSDSLMNQRSQIQNFPGVVLGSEKSAPIAQSKPEQTTVV